MLSFLKKQWFFVGIAVMVLTAFALPGVGKFVRDYKILKIGIFLSFLITGLTLDTNSAMRQLKNVKVLVAALLSSLLVFPAIAFLAAKGIFTNQDIIIGALIIGVAPVTVASGTVMTSLALGNVPLSLFICVLGNFASLITIPISLKLVLSLEGGIHLPVWDMLFGLFVTVLLPTILGQILRPFLKEKIAPYGKAFSLFSQGVVLLIIFNAVAGSSANLVQAGAGIFGVLAFMVALHSLILVLNYFLSRGIGLDGPSISAFTIQTSQKTLTVSYLVWAGFFAHAYPMALVPGIAYHMTQMIMDTMVAQRFREATLGRKNPAKAQTVTAK